jgi:drug/metabolite transporter (DMT)-like permease
MRVGLHRSLVISPPVLGIVFALLSILAVASGDIVAKYMSYRVSVIQILWVRFLVHFALGLAMTNWRRFPLGLATARPGLQIARGLLLIGSTYAFILALHYLPFVDVIAISFVAPVIISVLAATFLKEKMDAGRWTACVVGLVGALIVIRPGFAEASWALALPLVSAATFAVFSIITRFLSAHDPARATFFHSGLIAFAVISLAVPFAWRWPTGLEWVGLVASGLLAAASQHFFIKANQYQTASVIAPFSYSEIIWGTILGYLVFRDFPDAWTWLGAAVIVASGLYIFRRETGGARATTT